MYKELTSIIIILLHSQLWQHKIMVQVPQNFSWILTRLGDNFSLIFSISPPPPHKNYFSFSQLNFTDPYGNPCPFYFWTKVLGIFSNSPSPTKTIFTLSTPVCCIYSTEVLRLPCHMIDV